VEAREPASPEPPPPVRRRRWSIKDSGLALDEIAEIARLVWSEALPD
jgi:hypothetical protein